MLGIERVFAQWRCPLSWSCGFFFSVLCRTFRDFHKCIFRPGCVKIAGIRIPIPFPKNKTNYIFFDNFSVIYIFKNYSNTSLILIDWPFLIHSISFYPYFRRLILALLNRKILRLNKMKITIRK